LIRAYDTAIRVSVICFAGSAQGGLSLLWRGRRRRAGRRLFSTIPGALHTVVTPVASATMAKHRRITLNHIALRIGLNIGQLP
jgi:hypothetical protein